MKVYFFRSFHLLGDSRSQKIIDEYRCRGFDVVPVIWTRGQNFEGNDKAIFYRAKGLISGRLKNFFNFLGWHFFIIRFLFQHRADDFVIHCVDLDTALPCVPIGRMLGKAIVYDGFDHFASSRDLVGFLFFIATVVERLLCYVADLCILPDRARISQYGIATSVERAENVCIIANVPSSSMTSAFRACSIAAEVYREAKDQRLHLCYVGTLERTHRALEYIPRLCELLGDQVHFTVAGNGELETFFAESSANLNNLTFHGYVPYERGLQLMASSDVLYGPYLLSSRNHRFAAPNKMYEHLLLGRPLITNLGTPVADFVAENQTGYMFDGSFDDLVGLVRSITRTGACDIGERAYRLWMESYRDLRTQQINLFFSRLTNIISRRLHRAVNLLSGGPEGPRGFDR